MVASDWLSDYTHPIIQEKANRLVIGKTSKLEALKRIFLFVRDEIPLGFPPNLDSIKASQTILDYKFGNCTTKATLFNALCKVVDIPTRIHTGLIDLRIMEGIFPPFMFSFMPKTGAHSWIEVEVDGEWKPIDSYINDKAYYESAMNLLLKDRKTTGYSISGLNGKSSCEFNFGEIGFMQMGAVVADHGTWQDYSEYMNSDDYKPLNQILIKFLPILAKIANNWIEKIRLG